MTYECRTQEVAEPRYFLVWIAMWVGAVAVLLRCLS